MNVFKIAVSGIRRPSKQPTPAEARVLPSPLKKEDAQQHLRSLVMSRHAIWKAFSGRKHLGD